MMRHFLDPIRRIRQSVLKKRLHARVIVRRNRLPDRPANFRRCIEGIKRVHRYQLPPSLRYRINGSSAIVFNTINRPLTVNAWLRLSMHRLYQPIRWLAVMTVQRRDFSMSAYTHLYHSLVPTPLRGNTYRTTPSVQLRKVPLNEADHNNQSHSVVISPSLDQPRTTPQYLTGALQRPAWSRYRPLARIAGSVAQRPIGAQPPVATTLVRTAMIKPLTASPHKIVDRKTLTRQRHRHSVSQQAMIASRTTARTFLVSSVSRSVDRRRRVVDSQVLLQAKVIQQNKSEAIIPAISSIARPSLKERLAHAGSKTTGSGRPTSPVTLGSFHPSGALFVHHKGDRLRHDRAVPPPAAIAYVRAPSRQQNQITNQETMQETITENIVRQVEKTLSEKIEQHISSHSKGSGQWVERIYTDLNDRIILEQERLNPR